MLALARRMLGDATEAEDVVQEAFQRLARIDLDELDDVQGWLAVVVRRLALDFGSLTTNSPLTWVSDRWTDIVPASKSISAHRRASSSPCLMPVPTATAYRANRRRPRAASRSWRTWGSVR